MELEEALRHALDGQAVLFLGAGFSIDAQNHADENLPAGTALAEFLSRELALKAVPSLDLVSDMYKERRGEFRLIELLKRRLTAAKTTPEQAAFGTVPWRRIYTTNYDNVAELVCSSAARPLRSITLADVPSKQPVNARLSVPNSVAVRGFLESSCIQMAGRSAAGL